MSGHSRWAQVRHKKAITDQKRGQLFSKISRLISIAVKEDGPNPDENPKLRDALEKARSQGMGRETVERAIQRASGEAGIEELSQALYEGYGPGGAAFLIEVLSDNLNRTNHELRKIVEDVGGKLSTPGSVSWMFKRKMVADISPAPDPEKEELILIDAGAEEIERRDDKTVATLDPQNFQKFRQTIKQESLSILESSLEYVPRSKIELTPEDKKRLASLFEKLDEHGDVQEIYTNAKL